MERNNIPICDTPKGRNQGALKNHSPNWFLSIPWLQTELLIRHKSIMLMESGVNEGQSGLYRNEFERGEIWAFAPMLRSFHKGGVA